MRNYLKKQNKEKNVVTLTADELIARFKRVKNPKIKWVLGACIVIPLLGLLALFPGKYGIQAADEPMITLASMPLPAATSKRELINIPTGIAKEHPFVPYRVIDEEDALSDIPKFDLVPPPEFLNAGSEAARVMDTIVSGILYDKFSPSAILNIEGNDYLVKKGDIVNNYKILNIEKNSVTVKLGGNTFKAGIGEILTEGSVNYNDVSNLSKKFGGEKQ